MRRIISLSEIVELLELEEGWDEVCATAGANYNEATGSVAVRLNSFVRPVDPRGRRHLVPRWLPRSETVCESAPPDQAVSLARDIFQRWVEKVRQSIPSSVSLEPVESC